MPTDSPLTLADWSTAYGDGAAPRERLGALQQRLERESAPGVWIALAGRDAVAAQVAALEARAAPGSAAARALPLYGVPFAVKDNIDVAGFATTAACPAFAYPPSSHSLAVARLVEAGAVCMGKTNLDQFATGLVGTRSPYGRPSSALAADRISGGSSSGSAVAVARGDVAFALGTDTAGSGRVPAGFNNIVGFKPTPGRIGTSGVVPACRSLDCVSIFALTVADAAAVLALVEGPDPGDPYSAFATGRARFGASVRVGIPAEAVFSGDAGYGVAHEQAVAHLQRLGHRAVALDFAPLLAVAELLYGGPWVAERHAVVEALLARDPAALDPTVRAVIATAQRYSATDTFRALYALRSAQQALRAIWQQVDVLMVPTAPGHPRFAEVEADPLGVNTRLGTYTNFVNLLGWCALAVPAGFTANGLPYGTTFIAPASSDAALAAFGCAWQSSLDLPLGAGTVRPSPATLPLSKAVASVVVAPAALAAPTSPAPPWPASSATLPIAVVGAHLQGLPLNGEFVALGATLREATRTAPHYRLYALPDSTPRKPGMVRVAHGGVAIALEVWKLPLAAVGAFLASIPAPLGLGSVELEDGRRVHGFLCEAVALDGATDISEHGGWRAWLASGGASTAPTS